MAPLEWLTPDKLTSWLDRFAAFVFLAFGLAALSLGLADGGGFEILGVDGFVWLGACWILFALFTWASYRLRADCSERA